MAPILKDFEDDLDRIKSQLDFIDLLKKFASNNPEINDAKDETPFITEAKLIHEAAKRIHINLPLASGTLILYTCGRFEAMVRTLSEDLCQRLVSQAKSFARLPKKMRENLPIFTAKVISDHRKYGHAENGVRSFVSTLASNLIVGAKVEKVNQECLSITESNMQPDILGDLFSRVGAGSIWSELATKQY